MPKAKDKSPKPESGRRQNVANSSDVGNPRRSTSKERKCTSTPPNKTGKKDDVQSTENVKSAKELLEEIQEYRREAEKWMNCDTDTGSQTSQNSVNNISTAKPIKSGIVTEVVVAEVHQTEKSNDTTKKKRLRHRTLSHESAVRFADELLEGSEELVKVRKSIESPEVELSPKSQQSRQSRNQTTFNETVLSNLKLIASSKLVCQQRRASSLPRPRSTFLYPPTYPVTLFQDYSRDYEHYSPPSPAPDNPYEKQFVLIGAYSNNVSLSLPSVTPRPLREPTFDNFLTYGRSINIHEPAPLFKSASAEVIPATDHLTYRPIPISSLRYQSKTIGGPYEIASYFERTPTEYKYDLPTISSYQSPKKQLHRKSRQGASEFEGASYKTEPSHRSFLTDSDYETLKFGKLTPEPCQHPDDREFLKRLTREIHRSSRGSARKFLDLSPDFIEDVDQEKLLKLLKKYYEKLLQELFSGRHAKVARFLSSRGHILLSQAKSLRHRRSFVIDLLKKLKKMKLADHERKIVIEFCHLLEKSKQLFNGLRELPQYGHKQWHSYFGRTFDVYTKLWKFQQQHRVILDVKYGLKRWQIGEIASKIGQLYYHFYLRTSETAYLNEAYSFYYAIRGRSYYTHASKEDRCELMVKKLRYYARFIVASLLLKKLKLVRDLIKELDRQIIEYGDTFDPDDQNEWKIVADEVKAFIQAEPVVVVLHPDDYVVALTHRLTPQTTPPVDRSAMMTLSLQEALIIGSNPVQVKFSELTMDMFRMLQTLEREPTGDIQHMYDESPRQRYASRPGDANNKGYNLESSNKSSPHKYLLFKPTPNQIFIYLASACDDLPPNGVVLLYISAEGLIVPPMKHPVDSNGFDMGGLITTSKPDIIRDGKLVPQKHTELQVLHPGDLYPFTRRPMFLIIDSDNSFIFHDLPRYFGQPLVVLMSPLEQPSSLHPTAGDKRAEGSLFTLFLHCPLSAFCFCCDINTLTLGQWERAQTFIEAFLAEASQIVTRSRIDGMYLAFMGDDFLRLLILRFIFCETFLRMHRLFRGRSQRTRCSPPLPDDLYEHPGLTHIIIDLATHFQVRSHFHELSAMPASLASNRE